MTSCDFERLSAAEQASKWLCELLEGGEREQERFLAWVRQSPRHVEEFLLASALWKELKRSGEGQAMPIEAIVAELAEGERNVMPLPVRGMPSESPVPTSRRRVWTTGLAAAVLAVTVGLLWVFIPHPPTYSTAIGEQHAVRLPDGSVVYLNTRSRIRVLYSNAAREIELLQGEALFSAQHDPTRPFRVIAGAEVIQALGTEFNVYRRGPETMIAVLEGAVGVSKGDAPQTPVAAGEEARIGATGQIVKHGAADVGQAVEWRERRLVFRAARLEDVVAEVNRYSAQRIRLESAAARNTLLTATFAADDPQALGTFLKKYSDLSVERREGEMVVR